MVVAILGLPVKLTGDSATTRSMFVPLSTGAAPVRVSASPCAAARTQGDRPTITPPATKPRTKRRREGINGNGK